MQHSEHLSARTQFIGRPGFCTRSLEVTNDHRVQATVQTLHALNEDLEQRYALDLAVPQHSTERMRVGKGEA